MNPSVVSLFSGCGGLDLAFALEGFDVIWANEINNAAADTHEHNFPHSTISRDSIIDIHSSDIPCSDIIVGGFPCQDFSTLSKRQGINAPRGCLYMEFLRIVEAKKPTAFVAENVKGILSANKGEAIRRIMEDFSALGYTLSCKLYNFADYGVPQMRERVIIVGILGSQEFIHPAPTHRGKHTTSLEALQGVESISANNEPIKIRDRTRELLKKIPEGCNFTSIPKGDPLYVKGMISHVYRRLHRDKPSMTVIAAGGGGTRGYHYEEPRPLTNRELARLQTFPDNFIFKGSIVEVRRQIGNAVPPEGARHIARAIRGLLTKKKHCGG